MLVDLDKLEPEKPTICGGHSGMCSFRNVV